MLKIDFVDASETTIDGGSSDSGMDAVLLAQADTGTDPAGTPPSDPSASGGAPGISVIVPDASNRVTLAADTSIEDIQLDGNDLLLVQPDGSQIRIIGGALSVPTFVIGDIEVPQEVLVAALETSGFNVAAGPNNTLSVTPQAPTGSGGEFGDSSDATIIDGKLQTLGLLGDDAASGAGDGAGDEIIEPGNVASVLGGGVSAGEIVESADNPGGVDADPVAATGSITFFDPDFGETRTAEISASNVVSQVLKSGGSLTAAQLDALLAGFSLDTPGGITVESTTAAGGSIDWTYQVGNEAVDILASGEVITLSFDVQINDGIFTVTQTVTITVTGTNDQPVIEGTSVLAGTITEQTDMTGAATPLTATGRIVLSDVDLTDTHTASQSFVSAVWSAGVNPTADPGALVVNALNQSADTADWTYAVADSALDFLSAGETLTITYDVIVQDDSGTGTAASAVSQIVVTITGTNDAPVIDVTAGASSSELVDSTLSLAAVTAFGQLTFTDVDLSDTGHSASVVGAVIRSGESDGLSILGIPLPDSVLRAFLTIDAVAKPAGSGDGSIDYSFSVPDLTFDYLAKGQSVTLTYTVELSDGDGGVTTQQVPITITGTNDRPEILFPSTASGRENRNQTGSDALETHNGTMLFYDADRDDVGHSADASFAGATGVTAGLDISLIDNAVSINSVSKAINTQFGSLRWNFAAVDRAFDYLSAGQQVTLTYTVTLDDNEGEANSTTTSTVSVTITGRNDRPVITSGAQTGAVEETADVVGGIDPDPAAATGTISFLDVDLSDDPEASHNGGTVTNMSFAHGYTPTDEQIAALKAGFSLDDAALSNFSNTTGVGSTGWTYHVANSVVDFLGDGDSVELTYVVTIYDFNGGTVTQNVVITVTGTSDAPTVSAADNFVVNEEDLTNGNSGALTFSGDVGLSFNDYSSVGLSARIKTSGATPLDPSGNLILLSSDGQALGYSLLINPGPGLQRLEAINFRTSETIFVLEVKIVADGSGGFKVAYTFELRGNLDHVGPGDGNSMPLDFTVTAKNSAGETAENTFTVTINDDAPDAVNVTATVEENTATLISLVEGDGATVEAGEAYISGADDVTVTLGTPTYSNLPAGVVPGTPGIALVQTATGYDVSITPGTAFDALAEGESLLMEIPFTVEDSDGDTVTKTITVTVTGTNDAPVITSDGGASTATVSIAENSTAITTVTSTDVDGGAASYSISGGADAALFRIDSTTGALSFADAPNFEVAADTGGNNVYDVQVQVSDGAGGIDTQDIAVTVTDVPEGPTAVDDTAKTDEDTAVSFAVADLISNDSNPPGEQPLSITSVSGAVNGAVSLNAGVITFTPDANFSGQASFTYTLDNGAGTDEGTVSIDVAPVADAPVISVPGIGDPVPLSGDAVVNATTANTQQFASVSAIDGGYVVTWSSYNQDGNGWGVYAQRYASDGTPQDGETLVNTTTSSDQAYSSVSAIDGGYVVTWMSNNQDGSGWGIYAQRYASDGAPQGGETRVNTTTASNQQESSVSAIDGGYVVTWTSYNQDGSGYGIYAQRYASDGTPQGAETLVNTTTAGAQRYPSVSAIDGGYVVTWSSRDQDGSDYGIYAQRYASDGTPQGGETLVNTTTASNQQYSSVSAIDGGYVVTWSSLGQDGSSYGIYAQRYASDGTPQDGETRVNTTTANTQIYSSVSAIDGGYVVTWSSYVQDGSGNGIYAQRYASDGAPEGGEFRINDNIEGDQYRHGAFSGSGVAVTDDGTLVVVWDQDSGAGEIEHRLFELPPGAGGNEDTDIAINLSVALSDTDGSETLSDVTISDVPAGVILSAGTNNNDGTWTLTQADLNGLTLRAPQDWNGSFDLRVSVTSTETSNGDAATTTETFTVTIDPVNDAPEIAPIVQTSAVAEIADASMQDIAPVTGTLSVTDADAGDTLTAQAGTPVISWSGGTLSPVQISALMTVLGTGALTLGSAVSNGGAVGIGYSWDPAAADLDFLAAGQSLTVSYDVTVSDGTATSAAQPLVFTIAGTNDLPVARNDNPNGSLPEFRISEDETVARVFDVLGNDTLDVDAGAANSISLSTIRVYGAPGLAMGTSLDPLTSGFFTITVDASNRIQVELNNSAWQSMRRGETAKIDIIYRLHGDGSDGSTGALQVEITGSNDAPVLDVAASPAMTQAEDAGLPIGDVGTQVSTLVNAPGGSVGNVSDVDGKTSAPGMSITAFDTSHGVWYYHLDGYNAPDGRPYWFNANLAPGQVLNLRAQDQLYFAPNAGYVGTVDQAITFRAWDGVASPRGKISAPGTVGGGTAYSADTDTVSLTIENVNDAPVLVTNIADAAVFSNIAVDIDVSGSFADIDPGDVLSFSATLNGGAPLPAWLSIDEVTGRLTGTPPSVGVAGETLEVTVTATDTGGLSVADTFELAIDSAPVAPVITAHTDGGVTEDASYAGGTNLITNGGFETGNSSGWSFSGPYVSGYFQYVHSGGYAAGGWTVYSPYTPATMSQTFSTVAGVTYTISFWAQNNGNAAPDNSLHVTWNGATVASIVDLAYRGPLPNYTEFTYTFTATSDTSTLTLALENRVNLMFVDEISVVQLPGTETTAGTISYTDDDVGETHTVSVSPSAAGYLGSFSAAVTTQSSGGSNGTVNWTFNVADADIQHLAGGEAITQTYTVTIDDGNGGTVSEDIEVVLTGADEAPIPGTAGDDVLLGEGGAELLNGGLGSDILFGGGQADTFVFDADALADAGANIRDLIADYDFAEGDVVDLSSLLGGQTVVGHAADYVKMNGVFLEVDVDGTAGGAGFVRIAEFIDVPTTNGLRILVDDDPADVTVVI
ncbi:VCBS domain-containing protein [Hoeflea alexandrii]|uniref:Tandem-95 repeat protein n=2 Tax=Hoeflea alexandrii TaxID=288436 RepID=A0ABT1CKM9_9HYPH|nr:VCBS domain-containing protein [Hoeflea alexandrii]MCO6406754.1 tandem-95 repeat protein [Hoeflea alexandrii]